MRFRITALGGIFCGAMFLALIAGAYSEEDGDKAPADGIESLKKHIEELKGVKFTKPVESQAVDEEGLLEALKKQIERNESEKEIAKLLGLMSLFMPEVKDVAMPDILKEMSKQFKGLYVPEDGKYYYIEMGGGDLETSVAVHELTHALQDQHIGLAAFIKPDLEHLDRLMARRSLIEGEATCVQVEYGFNKNGQSIIECKMDVGDLMESITKSPLKVPIIADGMMFPYVEGSRFYQRFLVKNGWKKTGELFKSPPETTEQIIHEEKYVSGMDYPMSVKLGITAGDLGEGWENYCVTTLGEFWMLGFLSANQEDDAASWRAMIGWDGDRWVFCRNGKDDTQAAAAATVWDSEQDAKEFFEFAKAHVAKRWEKEIAAAEKEKPEKEKPGEAADTGQEWLTQDRAFLVKRDGNKVFLATNIPLGAREKVLQALLKAEFAHHPDDKDKGKSDEESTRAAEKIFLARLAEKTASAKVEGDTVTSKTGKCRMTFPKQDWKIIEKIGNPAVSLMATSAAHKGGSITVIESPAMGTKDPKDALNQAKDIYKQMYKDFALIAERETTLDEAAAFEMTISWSVNGVAMKMTQIVVIKDDMLYCISMGAVADAFEGYEPAARKVLETFKFKEE